jgi:hypothetical protein
MCALAGAIGEIKTAVVVAVVSVIYLAAFFLVKFVRSRVMLILLASYQALNTISVLANGKYAVLVVSALLFAVLFGGARAAVLYHRK